MDILKKYQLERRKKALGMLAKLSERISSGHLILSEFGFYKSNMDNSLYFKIKVISRNSDKEIKNFEKFS